MIKAVVYDLDDTLFPESAFRESGFRFISAYLRKHGLSISIPNIRSLYAKHPRSSFDALVERYDLPISAAKLVDLYRMHKPSIRVYAGVERTLKRLHKKYKLGLITDHYPKTQRNKMKALGLSTYFAYKIYSAERGTLKPDVALFEEMKKRLRCKRGEIVYVGDNEQKDFIGARAAGYITIKYRSGGVYRDHKGTKEYKADYEIDGHEEIFPLLEKISDS